MSETLLLEFHGIGKPHAQISEAEQPYWLETDDFVHWISCLDAIAKKLSITVIPTFDDGNRSDIEIVAPALAKYCILGLFFPCTGRIGLKQYLDETEIRALAQMGHEIGSHGIDHVQWTSLKAKALHREIHQSRRDLGNILNAKVDSVAIPFGAYNRAVLSAIRSAGFLRIYTSDQGIVRGRPTILRRYTVCESDDPTLLHKTIERYRSRQFKLISNAKSIAKSMW